MTIHSDDILDTLECFLDTCPALEDKDVEFEDRMAGENHTMRTMRIRIGGLWHLVAVKVED
jgi:hypothetical protein